MVENKVLKTIRVFDGLSDEMLEKIGKISQLETFDEERILFCQNQEKKRLYMLVSGKVFLNGRSSAGRSLTLDEVSAGRTFGISALMGESHSTFTAVCAETCSIITISGQQLLELFNKDFALGHMLLLNVVESFRSRTKMHTQQFLSSLASHPEIKTLSV